MAMPDTSVHPRIATIDYQGRRLDVICRIAFDGIEYVGRLWFSPEGSGDPGHPDRAAIPGRTRDAVIALAKQLNPQDLSLRYRRALAEKRRYILLRRVTDEILTKVRYLNQIAISVRTGLLDEDGATQEIELTERQLHEFIDRLRSSAGAEE
jgi:hypothetical protein